MMGNCLRLLLPCFALPVVLGQIFGIGPCPQLPMFSNFRLRDFVGNWYVVQSFPTMSYSCIRNNITFDGQDYYIREASKPPIPTLLPQVVDFYRATNRRINMVFGRTTSFQVENTAPFLPTTYWIMDTDYKNYAAVFTCQRLGAFTHRQNAMVMSRVPSVDPNLLTVLSHKFNVNGIMGNLLTKVEQSRCEPTEITTTTFERSPQRRFSLRLGGFELFSRRS